VENPINITVNRFAAPEKNSPCYALEKLFACFSATYAAHLISLVERGVPLDTTLPLRSGQSPYFMKVPFKARKSHLLANQHQLGTSFVSALPLRKMVRFGTKTFGTKK
jgi:hypothetical protein